VLVDVAVLLRETRRDRRRGATDRVQLSGAVNFKLLLQQGRNTSIRMLRSLAAFLALCVGIHECSAQHFSGRIRYNSSAVCNASQFRGLFFSASATGTFSLTLSDAGFTGSASTSTSADLLWLSTTTTTTSTTTILPALAEGGGRSAASSSWWGTSSSSTTTVSSGISTTTTTTSTLDVRGNGGSATSTTLSDSMGVVTSTTSTSDVAVTGRRGGAFGNWEAGSAQTTSATGSGGVETTSSTSSAYDYSNSTGELWTGAFSTDTATGSGPSVSVSGAVTRWAAKRGPAIRVARSIGRRKLVAIDYKLATSAPLLLQSTSTTGTVFLAPAAAGTGGGGGGDWAGQVTVATFTSSAGVTTSTVHTFDVSIGSSEEAAALEAGFAPWALAALLPGFLPPQLKASLYVQPAAFSSWADPAVAQACHAAAAGGAAA
jgi:trimeric autotransporter adhesin